jgi:hypothetical protein
MKFAEILIYLLVFAVGAFVEEKFNILQKIGI